MLLEIREKLRWLVPGTHNAFPFARLRIDTERIEDKRMREMIELSSVSIIMSLALPFVISLTIVKVQEYTLTV